MWQIEGTAHAKVCSRSAQGSGWWKAARGSGWGAVQGVGDRRMWCPGAWEMCRVGDSTADGQLVLAVLCWSWVLPAHETSLCHFQDCCQAVVGLLVPEISHSRCLYTREIGSHYK